MVLFTTHCPVCSVLEKALKEKNVEYHVCDDIPLMEALGIETVPMLGMDCRLLTYKEAMKYVMEELK